MSGIVQLLVILVLVSGQQTFDRFQTVQTCGEDYIVQTGDTLAKIAKKCQITVRAIIERNPHLRNPDLIYTGDVLELSQLSATDELAPSVEAPELVPNTGEVYVVQLGDNLAKIAKRTGRSVRDLIIANPQIKNPSVIYVGDRVLIPDQAAIDRAIAERQSAIASSVNHNGERWIDVDLAAQTVHAYEGEEMVRSFLSSTGRAATPTVTGQYRIWIKFLYDDMRGPGYYLKDVPYVMYFYKGYGLHGTYWHNNFGTPMSNGCVNLSIEDAAWLYDFAEVGTLVNVH